MDAMLFKMYLLEAKSFKHIPVEDKTPLEIAILINKSLNNPQYIVEEFCKLQIPKGYKNSCRASWSYYSF
ncbi:Mrh transcription modulator under heat shock [Escherichia phage RB69]|uniref:Mrh transcription modulator under heat shock n=1 Tax=Escherichia phage RB69 TaxID=12353 RepID=Q7Y5B5_BPR69|nr:Mrh transcription modulator under heat shock [Escherichia phage RB69]AAP75925.1 Mrh transcription modulator under heat shock [Escherichia phage RB69]